MRSQFFLVVLMSAAAAFGQVVTPPTAVAESRPETRASSRPVETFPWWGRVTGTKVNVRGGAGDFHKEVVRLERGSAVKVVARRGDWLACEVPGGVDLWISLRRASREYLEKNAEGAWVVKATRLQLRGTPSTDEPSLGTIEPGTVVDLVESRGDWGRIKMPESHPGWVFHRFVESWNDTAAAEKAFAAGVIAMQEAKAKREADMRALEARREAEKKRAEVVAAADEKFNAELAKPAGTRETKVLRERYEEVLRQTDDDGMKKRIERRLDVVGEWEKNAEVLAQALRQKEEAERRLAESEKTYREDLNRLRERKEEEARRIGLEKGRYKATGWVQLAPPSSVAGAPKYKMHRGDQREYYIVSDRLDFEEYRGKNIGVLEGDDPVELPGSALPVMKVRKIEIINAP